MPFSSMSPVFLSAFFFPQGMLPVLFSFPLLPTVFRPLRFPLFLLEFQGLLGFCAHAGRSGRPVDHPL